MLDMVEALERAEAEAMKADTRAEAERFYFLELCPKSVLKDW